MWLSYLLIGLIGAAFVAIVAAGIRNRRLGKYSCSCGGNCGACGCCPSAKKEEK